MDSKNDNYVKVLFQFYSNVLDEETNETMWAELVDTEKGLYKLDSIPFYAEEIASGDIFLAEFDTTQKMLKFKEIVEYSGNSTVQVAVFDKNIPTNEIRDIFIALGCITEKMREGYFVLDVPAYLNYKPIREKLLALQEAGLLDFAEPCLSDEHDYN